jgi:Arc/MetJ-type ribon-helix-helix transcriptional regulator
MMVRTQVQVTQEQLEKLRSKARTCDVSVSELVRRCVDRFLDDTPAEARRARWNQALAAVGRFRSKDRDVSANHDKYLADAYRK